VHYAKGIGLIQDNVMAHMWLNIAASNGEKRGREYRDIVEKVMTSSQIADAQKFARECVAKEYKGC